MVAGGGAAVPATGPVEIQVPVPTVNGSVCATVTPDAKVIAGAVATLTPAAAMMTTPE
jgi:hypothetical protein